MAARAARSRANCGAGAEPDVTLPTEQIAAPDPREAFRRALGREAAELAEIEALLRQIRTLHRELREQNPNDPRLAQLAKEIEQLERQTSELWQTAARRPPSAPQERARGRTTASR